MERSMRHRWSWTACSSWLMAQQASLSCELTEGVRGGFPAWRKKHQRTRLCAFIRSVSFEHVHVSLYNFFIHPMRQHRRSTRCTLLSKEERRTGRADETSSGVIDLAQLDRV